MKVKKQSYERFAYNLEDFLRDVEKFSKQARPFSMSNVVSYHGMPTALPLILKRLGVLTETHDLGFRKYGFNREVMDALHTDPELRAEFLYGEVQKYYEQNRKKPKGEKPLRMRKGAKKRRNVVPQEKKREPVTVENNTRQGELPLENSRLMVISITDGRAHVERCDFNFMEQLGVLNYLLEEMRVTDRLTKIQEVFNGE